MGKIKKIVLLCIVSISLFAEEKSIVVKDILDRKVTLNKPIKKVIALGTSLSYVTYLNAVDTVIGIESIELKDVEKRTYTYVNKEKVKNLPIIGQGGKAKRPNLEAIITLQPDVIFTITQDKMEADLLSKQLNIPVVVVGYGRNTIDFETVNYSLKIMGKILNRDERAEELINYILQLRNYFKKPTEIQNAYIGSVAYKGLQGITSTQVDFMPFKLANIGNEASSIQKSGHVFINKEFLLMKNPINIFIDTAGWKLVMDDFKTNDEYYKKLKAFKNNTVYLLLSNTFYYINIDQMLANSFFIAKKIYPTLYPDLNPVEKANEIFNKFVGEELYDVIKNDTGGYQKVYLNDVNELVTEGIF